MVQRLKLNCETIASATTEAEFFLKITLRGVRWQIVVTKSGAFAVHMFTTNSELQKYIIYCSSITYGKLLRHTMFESTMILSSFMIHSAKLKLGNNRSVPPDKHPGIFQRCSPVIKAHSNGAFIDILLVTA